MHSGLQEHSLSSLSDGMLVLMPENVVPIQDVLGDIEWVDSWLKEMGLSPTALTYINSTENDAKNTALDHSSKGVDHAELCSTFVQTGPALHTCQLSNGAVCAIPLEGNSRSIRIHLRIHGHQRQENTDIICPWAGCPQKLQYKNVARHIQSTH